MTDVECPFSSSLYASGSVVVANPIPASAILLVVMLLCACAEYLFSLAAEIKSRFFQQMFSTITEEILVVGVLSLLLNFGSSLTSTIPSSWCVMIQWTHVCLLFMGGFFSIVLCCMILVMFSRASSLRKFELHRIEQKSFQMSADEVRYKLAYQHFRLCCSIYRITEDLDCVCFSDYLLKSQKEQFVELGNLTWKSWLALSVMIVVNACRTRIPALVTGLGNNKDTVDIATYIVILGFLPTIALMYLRFTLLQRFDQFIENRGVATSSETVATNDDRSVPLRRFDGAADDALAPSSLKPSDLEDPRAFLLWQTPQSTMAIIQILFLALVWYSVVFCLNMLYITVVLPSVYQTLLFIIAALIPIVILILVAPQLLYLVALLSSLGSCFNEARVRAMISVAKGEALNEADGLEMVTTMMKGDGSNNEAVASSTAPVDAKPTVVVKKPPPALVIDDQALFRLANTSNEGVPEL